MSSFFPIASNTGIATASQAFAFKLDQIHQIRWDNRTVLTGTGSATRDDSGSIANISTGTTVGSTCSISQVDSGNRIMQVGGSNLLNTAKKFIFSANFAVVTTSTNSVYRLGIGKTHTEAIGNWITNGFGFVVRNTAIYGFVYTASTLNEYTLSTNAAGSEIADKLSVVSTGTSLDWYINSALKYSLNVTPFIVTVVNARCEATNGTDATNVRYRTQTPFFIDLE